MEKRRRTATQSNFGYKVEGGGHALSDASEVPQKLPDTPQTRPRKRSQDSEDDHLGKRGRTDLQFFRAHN